MQNIFRVMTVGAEFTVLDKKICLLKYYFHRFAYNIPNSDFHSQFIIMFRYKVRISYCQKLRVLNLIETVFTEPGTNLSVLSTCLNKPTLSETHRDQID